MPARRRLLVLPAAIVAFASALLSPATSLADGDPASDVLLGQNVFYPYQPPVPQTTQNQLNALTAAAQRSGFPIKVALIGSPVDLGVIPGLFGAPQKYADFLDQEISFRGKQPLLVVMSTGYGVQGLNPKATALAASLPKPAGPHSQDLARAAATVIPKLADASGHPISNSSGAPHSGSGSNTGIVIALAIAALLAAGALAAITLRRRHAGAGRSV